MGTVFSSKASPRYFEIIQYGPGCRVASKSRFLAERRAVGLYWRLAPSQHASQYWGFSIFILLKVQLFCKLCEDEERIVRKTCAEVFMLVSQCMPQEARRTDLMPRCIALLSDPEPTVHSMAYQVLGAFICTFAEPPITKLIYNSFGELSFVGSEGYEFRFVYFFIGSNHDEGLAVLRTTVRRYFTPT